MSRNDSQGLFWVDVKPEKGGPVREMPKIPKTGWKTPKDFPNLSSCKELVVDVETYDPELLTHGPGWARGVGHLVGVAIAADEHNAWYFPMRHSVRKKDNMDPKKVLKFLRDVLTTRIPKIGANILYDIGWLRQEGVNIQGPFIDVLHAEALIDENQFKYDLESISQKYLKEGKESSKLYKWQARFYGGLPNQKQRANIHRSPPTLVGPYAQGDVIQPLKVWRKQLKVLGKEKLKKVFDLESRLIPLLVDMRFRGVRVDLDRAEQAKDQLFERETQLSKKLKKIVGFSINVNASQSIARAFKKENLKYPLTEKGNPSFTKLFLNNHPHKIADLIVQIRQAQKARSTFIQNYILEKNIKGRLYCEFPQIKGTAGGTASGRFSSRNPNLQNIPARDPISMLLIRGCFIPDEGFDSWGCLDFSQIEYRFLAHHAVGEGAEIVREMYRKDPSTDFHQAIAEMIINITLIELSRKPAKTINFGLVYGMGKAKLKKSLGLSSRKANQLMEAYHQAVPFVRATFEFAMNMAQDQGFIRTILGRRSRFDQWEIPYDYDNPALPYKAALRKYGPQIQRAFTHKALNRWLQGGAADYMKMAMVLAYEQGLFDAIGGPPHLTVHDELDFSFNKADTKPINNIITTMNTAIPLRVPMMTDFQHGPNWAELKDYDIAI